MSRLNDLQEVELDILREFSKVADQKMLKWFVMFGTLLGAVRQKGFIPWDDDIDIAIPRTDYDRLRLSHGWFSEPYFLQTPQNDPAAAPRFLRLRRSDTTVLMGFPNGLTSGGNLGAYIDIFPLDDVPNRMDAKVLHNTIEQIQRQMLASAALDESVDEMPDWKELLCYEYGGVNGFYQMFAERYERCCARYSGAELYAIPVLSGVRGEQVYKKEWFLCGVEMKFERLTVPAPIGWKKALIVSFPDGIDEPPENNRMTKHTKNHFVDTRRSYREYLSRYFNMLDGIENKNVLLFGAGDSLRIWMERYSAGMNIICAFDNEKSKWDTDVYGVSVRSPEKLPGLLNEDSRLIITSIYHRDISQQLIDMGVHDFYIFVDGWNY